MNQNSIYNFIRIPDIISLGNGLSGGLSIVASINGHLSVAATLICLAGILDFFDGRMARKLRISSEFGKQLDSLCDLCSFIIAPAIFLYKAIPGQSILITIVISIYLVAGILRLARFNVTGTIENGQFFEGMPVPCSIVIICLYFLFVFFSINLFYWLILFVIHAALMISTFKIRKL